MAGGSGPSGGAEEKQALIDSINNSQLDPVAKAQYLAKAQGIAVNNFYDLPNTPGIKASRSVEEVQALMGEFGQVSADRDQQLLQRQAKLAQQVQALNATPGSRQTSNLSALTPQPKIPSLI